MTSRPATYSTILPDDMGNDTYSYAGKHGGNHGPSPAMGPSAEQPYSGNINHHSDRAPRQQNVADQKQPQTNERELIKQEITSNKKMVYGLLFIAAILLIGLGYMVLQNKKLSSGDVQVNMGPPIIQGAGPPNGPMNPQLWPNPGSQSEDRHLNTSSSARASAQNDKLLRQKQHRAPVQNKQSALARRRQGHSDQDDRRRLETIVEGSESQVDEVQARMHAHIAKKLREDAEADARDEALGTGQAGSGSESEDESQYPTIAPMTAATAFVVEELDEVLPDDADEDDDAASVKVAALCPAILTGGQRVGQECNRECAPGKTMCKSHLGAYARKNKGK